MSSLASGRLGSQGGAMSSAISRHFLRLREPRTSTIDRDAVPDGAMAWSCRRVELLVRFAQPGGNRRCRAQPPVTAYSRLRRAEARRARRSAPGRFDASSVPDFRLEYRSGRSGRGPARSWCRGRSCPRPLFWICPTSGTAICISLLRSSPALGSAARVERADEDAAGRPVVKHVNRLTQALKLGVLGQLFGHSFRVVVGRLRSGLSFRLGSMLQRLLHGVQLKPRTPRELGNLKAVTARAIDDAPQPRVHLNHQPVLGARIEELGRHIGIGGADRPCSIPRARETETTSPPGTWA